MGREDYKLIKIKARESFRKSRILAGESQNSLAKHANTTAGTISRVENRKSSITPKIAKKVVEVLGIGFDEIFVIEEQ